MSDSLSENKLATEGYIYNSYGDIKYLKHAVASVETLRRYDAERSVALFCSEEHQSVLKENSLDRVFNYVFILPEKNRSITGFKHNIHKFSIFEKNLFLDSDIVWCKHPDTLWQSFSAYRFTITGNQTSDSFFGGPKGVAIVKDVLFRSRKKTLKQFGLTYLSRVQSGMIYSEDDNAAKAVCEEATRMLSQRHLTHFRSRREEKGRSEESCEWSLAMAMAKLKFQVYPWLQGYNSPQLDFLEDYTEYDDDFRNVMCLLYSNRFVYDLKAIRFKWLQKFLISLTTMMPGKGDYLYTTPYCLHFGWYHQKEPFYKFSERVWVSLSRMVKEKS